MTMHTAEQAKKLWCPMARVANVGQVYNRVDTAYLSYQSGPDREHFERQEENCKCIATRCAAWRWGTFTAPPVGAPPGKIVVGVLHRSEFGYCGMAGKP